MPLTFFAHQLPVLPIARRWPHRMDGIALVVGSMAPDFAYVLAGSRFRLWAHGFPWLALFCVPVALVVSWLIARSVSPVLWDHLPGSEPFRLHDYRGLAAHRFVWSRASLSALIGVLTHAGLDHFTHGYGWFAQNVDWYDTVLADNFLGRRWTPYRVIQYLGHVGGSALCLWLLARYGRQRWMASAATQVEPFPVTAGSRIAIAAGVLGGLAAGVVWVVLDRSGSATDVMRVSGVTFASLATTCFVLDRGHRRRQPSPVSVHEAALVPSHTRVLGSVETGTQQLDAVINACEVDHITIGVDADGGGERRRPCWSDPTLA